MKSRLFVVDEETLEETKEDGIVKTSIPFDTKTHIGHVKPTSQFINSINSIMADMLQLQKGDYVFFWCKKKEPFSKSTITGVYRVISEPYFKFDDESDIYPFKVMVEEAYHFKKPITEYNVLNSPYIKTLLWNIAGKKASGKARDSIQITPAEASVLLSLLINENPDYTFFKEDESRFIKLPVDLPSGEHIPKPLSIDLTARGKKQDKPAEDHLFEYDIYNFVHLDRNNKMHSEKTLEGLFNQEIIKRNEEFFKKLPFDVKKIIWFGNYLPYSLDRTEMDYLIICSDDGVNPSRAYVIEFKKESINEIGKDTHFYRAMLYSKWVNENLFNGSCVTMPIIICEDCPKFNRPTNSEEKKIIDYYKKFEKDHKEFNVLPVKIYTVEFPRGANPIFRSKK